MPSMMIRTSLGILLALAAVALVGVAARGRCRAARLPAVPRHWTRMIDATRFPAGLATPDGAVQVYDIGAGEGGPAAQVRVYHDAGGTDVSRWMARFVAQVTGPEGTEAPVSRRWSLVTGAGSSRTTWTWVDLTGDYHQLRGPVASFGVDYGHGRTLAAVAVARNGLWAVRLRGMPEVVERERAALERFVTGLAGE